MSLRNVLLQYSITILTGCGSPIVIYRPQLYFTVHTHLNLAGKLVSLVLPYSVILCQIRAGVILVLPYSATLCQITSGSVPDWDCMGVQAGPYAVLQKIPLVLRYSLAATLLKNILT